MKLSFLLEQARGGELAVFSDKDKTDKIIVSYINMALIALYNRFQLSTEEAIITLQTAPARTIYTLDSTDAAVKVGNAAMSDDDVMSILDAFDESGRHVPINDENSPFSIYTVSYNQVQIPLLENGTYISIIYRKNPTLVTYSETNGITDEKTVDIPLQLLEPMLHYIGYRAHGSVNGNANTENSAHYMRFEESCRRVVELGILTADDTVGTTVSYKGFV